MRMTRAVAAGGVGLSLFIANGFAIAEKEDGGFLAAKNFSNTIYLTTDYVFRGVSFTDKDPAIQGSFDYTHPSGFYTGVWGSNWDGFGTESEIELDFYGGYASALGPIDYDVGALYYTFPGAEDEGFELDWFDARLGLSHTFDTIPLSPNVGVDFYYAPDYSGDDGDGRYYLGTLDLVLPAAIGLGFGVGHLNVAGGALTGFEGGFSYTHYQVSLSKTILNFNFDLTYYGTTDDCQDEYGAPVFFTTDVCTPGTVFTLSRTF
ncbi:MAG: TorF family putative porin [Pseudomonadota bacterium]|nr:TorF family putative porin [Pseudomonadota bacterium]